MISKSEKTLSIYFLFGLVQNSEFSLYIYVSKRAIILRNSECTQKHDKGCATEYTVKPIQNMNLCSN